MQILRETDGFEDVGYTYVPGVTKPWLTLMQTPQKHELPRGIHLDKGLKTLSHLGAGRPHCSSMASAADIKASREGRLAVRCARAVRTTSML